MNVPITVGVLVLAWFGDIAFRNGSLFEYSIAMIGLVLVSMVYVGFQMNKPQKMDKYDPYLQRGANLQEKLAFAWALETIAPEEYKPFIQYDAQSLYMRMEDKNIIPNIPYIRGVKNWYLNNISNDEWDVYSGRARKKYAH
jgi:hypothetical protein